jgi:hypothetical protein
LRETQTKHLKALQSKQARFRPLGTDYEGRIYYALSYPGAKKSPTKAERDVFTNWAWFVFVFEKNFDAIQDNGVSDNEDEGGDERPSGEKVWGFKDAAEIRKLSKWLEAKAKALAMADQPEGQLVLGQSKERSTSNDHDQTRIFADAGCKALCKSLNDFADFLVWRLCGEDGEKEKEKEQAASKAKGKKK